MSEIYSQPLEHGGILRSTVASPGPGTEFTVTLSSQYVHEIIAVNYVLTTDGTAANRQISLVISTPTNEVVTVFSDLVCSASQTFDANFMQGGGADFGTASFRCLGPLPRGLILPPLSTITSAHLNIQVTDQISSIGVTTKIWIP